MSTDPRQLTIDEVLRLTIDPCANRHKGNPQSVEVHKRVVHTKQETYKRIMDLLRARGEYGCTSKEIAAAMGKQLNCISGRCSELRAMKWVKDSGARREGAAVLILGKL